MRQVVLDTETTGIRVEEGHRVIEIGCLEMINRKLTGKHFHSYINPEREIESGALAVHGISNEFLHNKPLFSHIVKEMMEFISGAELIIHNAPFDLSFLDHELMKCAMEWRAITDYCNVIDTLQIARKLHVGQRNSLDALCKRYGIDNSKRDLHGALLDAHLLARVYLAMTGGQGSFFDGIINPSSNTQVKNNLDEMHSKQNYKLTVLMADEQELQEHQTYLAFLKKNGKCVWE